MILLRNSDGDEARISVEAGTWPACTGGVGGGMGAGRRERPLAVVGQGANRRELGAADGLLGALTGTPAERGRAEAETARSGPAAGRDGWEGGPKGGRGQWLFWALLGAWGAAMGLLAAVIGGP